jgi:hypothetical protein
MQPFLSIPFSKVTLIKQQSHAWAAFVQAPYYLSEWYIYSDRYVPILGHALHAGIDYHVPYGTAVYSPINGYISASYNIERARRADDSILTYQWSPITYWLGYCVQLVDPMRQVFLLFGHLSYIARGIPFQPPLINDEGELFAAWFSLKKEHMEQLASCHRLKPIRRWDYIGDVWVSWLALLETLPTITETPRDRLPEDEYPTYSYPHLHRNTYTRDEDGVKQTPIDPYDIYDEFVQYPDLTRPDCPVGNGCLMRQGDDGRVLCVDE